MATARFFELYDSVGAPMTTAVPSFVSYLDLTSASRTAPAITHAGDGQYVFTPSDADEALGCLFVIDTGAGVGGEPHYVSGAIHLPDGSNQFWAFHLEDNNSNLWASTAPTIGSYKSAAGATLTSPTLRTFGPAPWLFAAVPTSADITAGAGIRFDSPANASPTYWHGYTTKSVVALAPTPPAVAQPSTYQQALQGTPTAVLWKDYQEELAPPWLRAGSGKGWLRALGDVKDAAEARVRDAVKVRMPDSAPTDALAKLAAERGLEQGSTETSSSFRARLKGAWDAWTWAGTPTGVLRALWYAGYTNVYLLTGRGQSHTLDGSLNVVTASYAGGQTATMPSLFWNGFRVIFPAPLPSSWGTLPSNSSDEVNSLRRLVKQWKGGHSLFEGFTVLQTGLVWGFPVTQSWGTALLTYGGTAVTWTPD